jgi:hypothetical protein
VGSNGGVADPAGAFQVVVRSVTCTPLPGSTVTIDFGACTPDIHIGSAQISPVTVDCAGRRVSAVTDANGIARFIVLGGASNPTGATPGYTAQGFCQSVPTCAKVYADGFLLASIAVSTYDQNMSGGVNPADVSAWLGDIFSGQYFGRSDYDANGLLSPVDLSKLLGVSLNHRSTSSSAAYCN